MKKLEIVATHPDPVATARRAERKRFLGEELTPVNESPWLVQMVLGGRPPLEITSDGIIPWRDNGVLPLRHGFSRTGAPASCLIDIFGVRHLRARTDEGSELEVDCAACKAWQATTRAPAKRAAAVPALALARLRAAFVPGKAA